MILPCLRYPIIYILFCVGLGAVRSLQVQVTDESIEVSWSPPNAPVNTNILYTVMYVSLTTANGKSTSVTTEASYLRIRAIQGETYEITVIPHSTSDTGDSTTVIAQIDCKCAVTLQLNL